MHGLDQLDLCGIGLLAIDVSQGRFMVFFSIWSLVAHQFASFSQKKAAGLGSMWRSSVFYWGYSSSLKQVLLESILDRSLPQLAHQDGPVCAFSDAHYNCLNNIQHLKSQFSQVSVLLLRPTRRLSVFFLPPTIWHWRHSGIWIFFFIFVTRVLVTGATTK